MTKFNIGDKAWIASYRQKEKYITCPDCLGNRFLTVILGDGSQVTIDCTGCQRGYDPPLGVVTMYLYETTVEEQVISHVEQGPDETRYGWGGTSTYYISDAKNVFATREEAEARALVMKSEAEAEEAKRLLRKDHDTRSWAWEATYHRGCIRRAQKDLEYHTKKLAVAQSHAKEKKASPAKREDCVSAIKDIFSEQAKLR